MAAVLFVVPYLAVGSDRQLARLFLGVALVAAYEAAFTTVGGATPGKIIAGTRTISLDRPSVDAGEAIKRGLLVAIATVVVGLAPLVVLGALAGGEQDRGAATAVGLLLSVFAIGIVSSVLGSRLRRSFIDRICGTFVVTRSTTAVPSSMLEELADVATPPTMSRWGALATFDQRRRARAGRLDDAPFLVVALLAVVFATSVPDLSAWVIALLAVGWEVVFVLDETWRVSRWGATNGHQALGLAVVDVDTGEPPTANRALLRAVAVSLPLYLLPFGAVVSILRFADEPLMLVPFVICTALLFGVAAWLRLTPGRGPHDLLAHTEVVELAPGRTDRVAG